MNQKQKEEIIGIKRQILDVELDKEKGKDIKEIVMINLTGIEALKYRMFKLTTKGLEEFGKEFNHPAPTGDHLIKEVVLKRFDYYNDMADKVSDIFSTLRKIRSDFSEEK